MNFGFEIKQANTFFSRLKGLMFKRKKIDYGLLLENTNGVHTCFMFQSIDIFLLDKDFNVLYRFENVKPWRIIWPKKGVRHILELPINSAKKN